MSTIATTAMAYLREHTPLCGCGRRLDVAAGNDGPVLVCPPCATVTALDGPVLDELRAAALTHAETVHALANAPRPNLVKPIVRLYRTSHRSTIPGVPSIGRRDTYALHCRQCGCSWKVYQNRYHGPGCPNADSFRYEAPPTEDWRPWSKPYHLRAGRRRVAETRAAS